MIILKKEVVPKVSLGQPLFVKGKSISWTMEE